MAEEQRPKQERVHCNQCRGETWHALVKTLTERGHDEEEGFSWITQFDLLQCLGCREAVLRRMFWFSENPDEEVQYFPPPVSRHPPNWRWKLPSDLRETLEEVYRSLDANNLRLPMMGARTLIDMVMNEKVGDVGGFKTKLKELEKKGLVSANNREVLEAALDAGSAAAHRGHAAEPSEMQSVMDIVENLLQAVYVFPGIAQKLKKSTPPRPARKKAQQSSTLRAQAASTAKH